MNLAYIFIFKYFDLFFNKIKLTTTLKTYICTELKYWWYIHLIVNGIIDNYLVDYTMYFSQTSESCSKNKSPFATNITPDF